MTVENLIKELYNQPSEAEVFIVTREHGRSHRLDLVYRNQDRTRVYLDRDEWDE